MHARFVWDWFCRAFQNALYVGTVLYCTVLHVGTQMDLGAKYRLVLCGCEMLLALLAAQAALHCRFAWATVTASELAFDNKVFW